MCYLAIIGCACSCLRWLQGYVVWCDVLRCGNAWCGVVWCDVMWCDVMWCDVMWCDVMCCIVMWRDVMWCVVLWCDVMWWGKVYVIVTFIGRAGRPVSPCTQQLDRAFLQFVGYVRYDRVDWGQMRVRFMLRLGHWWVKVKQGGLN